MTITARYGYVWCPVCERVKAREFEVQPLPRCATCHCFMEPLLCDASDCDHEAIVAHGSLGFCSHHVDALVMA